MAENQPLRSIFNPPHVCKSARYSPAQRSKNIIYLAMQLFVLVVAVCTKYDIRTARSSSISYSKCCSHWYEQRPWCPRALLATYYLRRTILSHLLPLLPALRSTVKDGVKYVCVLVPVYPVEGAKIDIQNGQLVNPIDRFASWQTGRSSTGSLKFVTILNLINYSVQSHQYAKNVALASTQGRSRVSPAHFITLSWRVRICLVRNMGCAFAQTIKPITACEIPFCNRVGRQCIVVSLHP